MAQEDLIPMSERSKEEVKIIAARGGVNSGKTRRKKKLMKEQAQLLLSLPLADDKAKKQLQKLGINTDDCDNQMALLVTAFKKGLMSGDKGILEFFRDTMGEKPKESIEVTNVDASIKEVENYLEEK